MNAEVKKYGSIRPINIMGHDYTVNLHPNPKLTEKELPKSIDEILKMIDDTSMYTFPITYMGEDLFDEDTYRRAGYILIDKSNINKLVRKVIGLKYAPIKVDKNVKLPENKTGPIKYFGVENMRLEDHQIGGRFWSGWEWIPPLLDLPKITTPNQNIGGDIHVNRRYDYKEYGA